MDISTIVIIASVLVILVLGRFYFSGRRCHIKTTMPEKVIIVTGATAGIGKETAIRFAQLGATVVLACRSAEKTLPLVDKMKEETFNSKIHYMNLDCASLKSCEKFSEEFKAKFNRLDILVHNAGSFFLNRGETKDGLENSFQTNYLSQFFLTQLLMDRILATKDSRLVFVSSTGHLQGKFNVDDLELKNNYSGFAGYALSKLLQVMLAKELANRLEKHGIKTASLHPGAVRTEIWGKGAQGNKILGCLMIFIFPFFWYFSRNAEQGAQTTIECSLMEQDKLISGGYYDNCRLSKFNPLATEENNRKLWDKSCEILRNMGYSWNKVEHLL